MTQPALRSLRDQRTDDGYCLYRSLLSADEVADVRTKSAVAPDFQN